MSDWRCWMVIGVFVLIMGVIIGVLLRRNQADKLLLEMMYAEIEEIREEADHFRGLSESHKATADRLLQQAQVLATQLAASRKRAKAVNMEPKTLPECMEGLQVLSAHVKLLEHDLAIARAEAIEMRKAYKLKEEEAQSLREALDLSKESIDMTVKTARKQKRNSIIGTTLVCSAVAVGMYGIGTLR